MLHRFQNGTIVERKAGEYIYKHYELNIEKINSVDDCKKILKFLCGLILKPTPDGIAYNNFEEVEQYFE